MCMTTEAHSCQIARVALYSLKEETASIDIGEITRNITTILYKSARQRLP